MERNLISQQDLELAEAENNLYKINVSLQKARLKAAESGEKQEQIDYVKKSWQDF